MFIKVFMNDNSSDSFEIHMDEVVEIENNIKSYLNKEGYEAFFYYHEASYQGTDFVEVSHEGELSKEIVSKLCSLLKNITVEGGYVEGARRLTLNMNNSLKYINFIKIDRCIECDI